MQTPRSAYKGPAYVGAAGTILVVAFAMFSGLPAGAGHNLPADKVAVAGASLEILGVPATEGSQSEIVEILNTTIRSSNNVDLILQLTYECALWTDITVIGNSESEAIAKVSSWVEIDGVVVPVSSDDFADPGHVVFCNRAYKAAMTDADDEDQNLTQFIRTRAANSFGWFAIDVPSGIHEISVKAQLESQVTGIGEAQAAIGKRTLVVEPVRLGHS